MKKTMGVSLVILLATASAVMAAPPQAPACDAKRDSWQNVPGILAAMDLDSGAWVADVGSGDGYLTFHLAAAVGASGHVFAVDVGAGALDRLQETLFTEDIDNVSTVHSEPDDPLLPSDSFDAVVILHAYHEMDEHEAMLAHLRRVLKPGGRLVVLDVIEPSRREASRGKQTAAHEIGMAYVRAELEEAGFEVVEAHDPFVERPGGDEMWLLAAIPDPSRPNRSSAP